MGASVSRDENPTYIVPPAPPGRVNIEIERLARSHTQNDDDDLALQDLRVQQRYNDALSKVCMAWRRFNDCASYNIPHHQKENADTKVALHRLVLSDSRLSAQWWDEYDYTRFQVCLKK